MGGVQEKVAGSTKDGMECEKWGQLRELSKIVMMNLRENNKILGRQ